MAGYSSYADFYERGPQRPFVVQNCLRGTAQVTLTRLAGNPPGAHRSPQLAEMLLIISGSGVYGMRYNLGLGWRKGRFRRGDMLLAPPEIVNEYHTDSETSFGGIALPLSFVETCLEELGHARPADFGALHDRIFRDRAIANHVYGLLEYATSTAIDPLYLDDRLVDLMTCLIDKAGRADARRQRKISLDKVTISRVFAYIEDNLAQELTLSELAFRAGLSMAHFARAFRQSVGTPPHRYVLNRRVERAKALLRHTQQPIADVALDCGFSSQAHLTSIFSRLVGTTPGRYRKGV